MLWAILLYICNTIVQCSTIRLLLPVLVGLRSFFRYPRSFFMSVLYYFHVVSMSRAFDFFFQPDYDYERNPTRCNNFCVLQWASKTLKSSQNGKGIIRASSFHSSSKLNQSSIPPYPAHHRNHKRKVTKRKPSTSLRDSFFLLYFLENTVTFFCFVP